MTPLDIHPIIFLEIKKPKVFDVFCPKSKLSEHINFWNRKGFTVIEGNLTDQNSLKLRIKKIG